MEKALEAIHVLRGIDYEWTHDIARLIDRLNANRVYVPDDLDRRERLTHYAGKARYPGLGPPTTESDWREALELAERAVR